MTGFESWVRAGLELGAREVLIALEKVLGTMPGHKELTPDEVLYLTSLVADVLQEQWPPWKRAATNQVELALDPPVTGDRPFVDREELPATPAGGRRANLTCTRCKGLTSRLSGTPYGPLCPRCLSLYIDRKWPENTPKTDL